MSSALQKAIDQGNLQAVVAALDAGADIEEADIHGYSGLPLRKAAFLGHNAIVAELLKRGADIHALNHDGVAGPVRAAVRGKKPATVRLLLEHGADIPAGVELGLPPAEVQRARLVADISRRKQPVEAPTPRELLADHELEEISVSQEEFMTLFSRPGSGRPFHGSR